MLPSHQPLNFLVRNFKEEILSVVQHVDLFLPDPSQALMAVSVKVTVFGGVTSGSLVDFY